MRLLRSFDQKQKYFVIVSNVIKSSFLSYSTTSAFNKGPSTTSF